MIPGSDGGQPTAFARHVSATCLSSAACERSIGRLDRTSARSALDAQLSARDKRPADTLRSRTCGLIASRSLGRRIGGTSVMSATDKS